MMTLATMYGGCYSHSLFELVFIFGLLIVMHLVFSFKDEVNIRESFFSQVTIGNLKNSL